MATNQHGGYRQPADPAPVSGPGAMSRRTDGGPAATFIPGMPYGEGQETYDMQTSAPMGSKASQPRTRSGSTPAPSGIVPLGAPSQRPDEPLTTGNPLGPGAGAEVLPLPPAPGARDVEALGKYLPQLRMVAAQPDAPQGFKAFVQFLNGQ